MKLKILASFVSLALLLLLCVGCDASSTVAIALDAISTAAAVAPMVATALVAAGVINSAAADLIYTYSKSVSTAASQASVEWASSDPEATKITVITTDFASAIAPDIPGAPAELQAVIKAISSAIQELMNILHSKQAAKMISAGGHVKLSYGDKQVLSHAKSVAVKTIAYCDKQKK